MRDRELAVAKREVASKEFRDAKPWRDEAKRIGVTPAQLLEGFLGWDNKFDADPVAAADAFAAAGFRLPLHMIDDAPAKDAKSPDDEYRRPLDKAIAKAIVVMPAERITRSSHLLPSSGRKSRRSIPASRSIA